MLKSFSEFKYFQSFRVPVEVQDDVKFLIEHETDDIHSQFIENVLLKDVSVNGVGFVSNYPLPVGSHLRCSLHFKKIHLDFGAKIVRAFYDVNSKNKDMMNYGAEIDSEDCDDIRKFLECYLQSLPHERMRDSMLKLALTEDYSSAKEGFEVFSLLLSLFNDITQFGEKEKFVESMLEEIVRILNGQRASIFLINTSTNELEAVAALGIDKKLLKFDYRKGIAGSVFTTGVSLNIDTNTDKVRFSQEIDRLTGYKTTSIICAPISNREDKIIGVIEVLNKRNEERFTIEDEKTMKVLALILSSVFHNYNPMSEKSQIRRFSAPYDRKFAWIGRSVQTLELRKSILRLKDIDSPLLVQGEIGVGKKLYSRILHNEGKRGLAPYMIINCKGIDENELFTQVFGREDKKSVLEKCAGGTVVFDEISFMPLKMQTKLFETLSQKRIEGSHISLDVRFIFTSSVKLKELVEVKGLFNANLYQFITAAEMFIDPIRKRPKDVEDLISYFLRRECKKQGLLVKELSEKIKNKLIDYPWPGNVTELKKAMEKLVLFNPKNHVISDYRINGRPVIDENKIVGFSIENLPFFSDPRLTLKERLALVERELILAEIKRFDGNKSKTAKMMGISREALRKKLLFADEVLRKFNESTPPVKLSQAS